MKSLICLIGLFLLSSCSDPSSVDPTHPVLQIETTFDVSSSSNPLYQAHIFVLPTGERIFMCSYDSKPVALLLPPKPAPTVEPK